MNNLQETTERVCELKGQLVALDAFAGALLQQLPARRARAFSAPTRAYAEMARTSMLNAAISEHAIAAFELDVERTRTLVGLLERQPPPRLPTGPPWSRCCWPPRA